MSVVGAIEPSLRQAEIERAKRKRPDSLDAYDLYLRALPFAAVAMPEDADKALPLLDQALALEPDYRGGACRCRVVPRTALSARRSLREAARPRPLAMPARRSRPAPTMPRRLATAGFVIGLVDARLRHRDGRD